MWVGRMKAKQERDAAKLKTMSAKQKEEKFRKEKPEEWLKHVTTERDVCLGVSSTL